jgi:hypothetical protein
MEQEGRVMSMIGSQVDRLRERAEVLRRSRWPDGTDDARLMEDAADTIWRLRCKLAGMVDMRERARVAETENVKLKELVRALDWCTENPDRPDRCDRCPLPQSKELTPECEVRMYELGVWA